MKIILGNLSFSTNKYFCHAEMSFEISIWYFISNKDELFVLTNEWAQVFGRAVDVATLAPFLMHPLLLIERFHISTHWEKELIKSIQNESCSWIAFNMRSMPTATFFREQDVRVLFHELERACVRWSITFYEHSSWAHISSNFHEDVPMGTAKVFIVNQAYTKYICRILQ